VGGGDQTSNAFGMADRALRHITCVLITREFEIVISQLATPLEQEKLHDKTKPK